MNLAHGAEALKHMEDVEDKSLYGNILFDTVIMIDLNNT